MHRDTENTFCTHIYLRLSDFLRLGIMKRATLTTSDHTKYSRTAMKNQPWHNRGHKFKPSQFQKSFLSMISDEDPRIVESWDMKNTTHEVHSVVSVTEPIFQASPRVLVFQDWKPFSIVEKKIFFRNNDKVARKFKIIKTNNPNFQVSVAKNSKGEDLQFSKVAYGMEVMFIVTFTPSEMKDYSIDLVCCSEREKFIVPVRAICAIPQVTLPDELDFGHCHVKGVARRTCQVQNTSQLPVTFTLQSSHAEFSYTDTQVSIEPGAWYQLDVYFRPRVADHTVRGDIQVEFGPNQRCYIAVLGTGQNSDIFLSDPALIFPPTYVSCTSYKTFIIKNSSDHPVEFEWKAFASQAEEEEEKCRLQQNLLRQEEIELFELHQRISSGHYDTSGKSISNDSSHDHFSDIQRDSWEPVQMNEPRSQYASDSDDIPEQARLEEMEIVQKYENMYHALEKDPMAFVHSNFTIFPTHGRIWSHSEMEVSVKFNPDIAMKHLCTAYAEVSGRQDRLPLELHAAALGPEIGLSFRLGQNTHLVGDVCVNSRETCELRLVNKGEIPANWTLLPPITALGHKFSFSCTEGLTMPGEVESLTVTFEHDREEEFHEIFRFAVQGNDEVFTCSIKGHVVLPSFHFDCTAVKFGVVSCGCPHVAHLRLVNTSPIPLDLRMYVLTNTPDFSSLEASSLSRIDYDGTPVNLSSALSIPDLKSFMYEVDSELDPQLTRKLQADDAHNTEFDIQPSSTVLQPGEKRDIVMTFIPTALKVYDCTLYVDVLSVGTKLLSVPITAECKKGELTVDTTDLLFGECFINFPYEREIILHNPVSAYASFYEIVECKQNESILDVGELEMGPEAPCGQYVVTPAKAVVRSSKSVKATVRFTPTRLGPFIVPVSIKVAGSTDILTVTLHGTCRGPYVEADMSDLSFGTIQCLANATKSFFLINSGPIPANAILTIRKHQNNFIITPTSILLGPNESTEVTVTAILDDVCNFTDELQIACVDSDQVSTVRISASGTGSTLVCEESLRPLDFGLHMTNTKFEKTVYFTNKCRRSQSLRWVNKTIKDVNAQRVNQLKTLERGPTKVKQQLAKSQSIVGTFTVSPSECVVAPGATVGFTCVGQGKSSGIVTEEFSIEGVIGKERDVKLLGQAVLTCELVKPLLTFSSAYLQFQFQWDRESQGLPIDTQTHQILTLTNSSPLSLECILKADSPFRLSDSSLLIDPGHSVDIRVYFDPFYRGDKLTHVVESSLQVSYRDHHQVNSLPLYGQVSFPNLLFDCDEVAFGCLLNGTEKRVSVTVTNTSPCPADFEWYFVEPADHDPEALTAIGSNESSVSTILPCVATNDGSVTDLLAAPVRHRSLSKTRRGSHLRTVNLSVEQVVDIVPVRLCLLPGESSVVQFHMTGLVEGRLHGDVRCAVVGGPEYALPVTGEASNMTFQLSQSLIDFAAVDVLSSKERELVIFNRGKVDFEYEVTLKSTESTSGQVLQISYPKKDCVVEGGSKAKINLKLTPFVAGLGMQTVLVRVAHFDPVEVVLQYNATLPTVYLDISRYRLIGPRNEEDLDSETLQDAWKRFEISCTDDAKRYLHTLTKRALESQSSGENSLCRTTVEAPQFVPKESIMAPTIESTSSATNADSTNALVVRKRVARRMSHKAVSVSVMDADLAMQRVTLNSLILQLNPDALSPALITANYVCDFGNIIVGAAKKRKFHLVSQSSTVPLRWSIDPKLTSAPDLVFDVCKGKLELGEKTDITVKFQPTQEHYALGPCTLSGFVYLKGSVAVRLSVTATICMPDVRVSRTDIDFGGVLIGQCQQQKLKLYNPSPIPSTWKLKVASNCDQHITIKPDHGVLKPKKSQILLVEYTPTEERISTLTVDLRVEGNSRPTSLKLKGTGISTPVVFDPPLVDFGAVIPGKTVDRVVTLQNPNPFAVEVYCPEHDSRHYDEVLSLYQNGVFDDDGILRTAVRVPGEVYNVLERVESELFRTATSVTLSSVNKPNQSTGSLFLSEKSLDAGLRVPVVPCDTSQRTRSDRVDVIAVFPTMVPEADQWMLSLAQHCRIPVLDPDTMIRDVLACDFDIGKQLRQALKKQTTAEVEAESAKLRDLQKRSDDSQSEAIKKFKKQNPKVKEIPPNILQTDDWHSLEAYKAAAECISLTHTLLVEVVRYRLSWLDTQSGVIINATPNKCSDLDFVMCLRALKEALPSAQVLLLDFKDGKDGFRDFVGYQYEDTVFDLQQLEERIHRTRDTLSSISQLDYQEMMKMKSNQHNAAISSTEEPFVAPNDSEDSNVSTVTEETPELHISDGYPPIGNEPWFDHDRDTIQELDAHEFKTLTTRRSIDYLNHKLFFLRKEKLSLIDKKSRLDRIWDEAADCLVEDIKPSTPFLLKIDQEPAITPGETGNEENEVKRDEIPLSNDVCMEVAVPVGVDTYEHYSSTIVPQVLSALTATQESIETSDDIIVDTPMEEQVESFPLEVLRVIVDAEDTSASVMSNIQSFFKLTKSSSTSSLQTATTTSTISDSTLLETKTLQVVRKPLRPPAEVKGFDTFTVVSTNSEAATAATASYRWVLPPNSSTEIRLQFTPTTVRDHESAIKFEVAGSGQQTQLRCIGTGQYPSVSADPRHVFMKRVKSAPAHLPPPAFRYILSSNFYSFGPLQIFKTAPVATGVSSNVAKKPVTKKTSVNSPPTPVTEESRIAWPIINCDTIRVENNGRFPCRADLSILSDGGDEQVFFIEQPIVELAEGESRDVRIFAYPKQTCEYSAQLVIKVSENPEPVKFALKCWGTAPRLEMTGPWTEQLKSAEAAVASCADKKLLKDFEAKLKALKDRKPIELERVLTSKKEVQSFQIKSESLLPVQWSIDTEDLANSTQLHFSRLAGELLPGKSETIDLTLQSATPGIVSGGFTFNYSDTEGGMSSSDPSRVTVQKFKVTGEVYNIQAAAVVGRNDKEDGEVDFGLLKVGETASQIVKLYNKGSYEIGFKLEFAKRNFAQYVTFEPSEGVVPAGKSPVEIKIAFCCSDKELSLQSNKDVRVLISEPRSNEVVDKFPIFISAICKYSRFRVSPSRGLSFGAVRFDAEVQKRSIDLKNEGPFEFRYIVCPATAIFQTLDTDLQTFFASSVPSTLRATDLGDDYASRLGLLSARGSKKPAIKGKGGSHTSSGNVLIAPYSSSNPLVIDSDNFNPTVLSTESLQLGSFSVSNRAGLVLPGQSLTLDIQFTPGGSNLFKESLRVYISGCDPQDGAYKLVQSYEISGESCLPCISLDCNQVFEEQELKEGNCSCESIAILNENTNHITTSAKLTGVYFSVPQNQLFFGHVLCSDGNSRGIMERVKIVNPSKVDCKVAFKVSEVTSTVQTAADVPVAQTSKSATKGGANAKKEKVEKAVISPTAPVTQLGFTVHPECWDIPAHEHRYVNIYFNPTEMKSYRAAFHAVVDTGTTSISTASSQSNCGSELHFDLCGYGSLPNVTIENNCEVLSDGTLGLDIGRVHVGRSIEKIVTLRNDGAFPATCLLDLQGHSEFLFLAQGTSIIVSPGQSVGVSVTLKPLESALEGERIAQLRVTVLHNPFGVTCLTLKGSVYSYDAFFDTHFQDPDTSRASDGSLSDRDQQKINTLTVPNIHSNPNDSAYGDEHLLMPSIDFTTNTSGSVSKSIKIHSRVDTITRYQLHLSEDATKYIQLTPSIGHLPPYGFKEILAKFTAGEPVLLDNAKINCELQRIKVTEESTITGDFTSGDERLHKLPNTDSHWDNTMKVTRVMTDADRVAIDTSEAQWDKYNADKAKATMNTKSKSAPALIPPAVCNLVLEPKNNEDDPQYVTEWITEPAFEAISTTTQKQSMPLLISAVADRQNYSCDMASQTLNFAPTFMFQSMVHKFTVTSDSLLELPLKWTLENFKHRLLLSRSQSSRTNLQNDFVAANNKVTTINPRTAIDLYDTSRSPFTIEPEACTVPRKSSQEFTVRFHPMEVEDYLYLLEGRVESPAQISQTPVSIPPGVNDSNFNNERVLSPVMSTASLNGAVSVPIRAMLSGQTKRPVCHFEIEENREYLQRRMYSRLKNEKGLFSSIECQSIRVVALESVGLRTRNKFRFSVVNPTSHDYEFCWETVGDADPAWRCVQTSGTLFSGKRTHMVFEYVAETSEVAEAFFKFRIPKVQLEQLFLFAGQVKEPSIAFSTSKVDFRTVSLHGEGSVETVYLVNKEHVPFNFAFEKTSLSQLIGNVSSKRSIVDVTPTSGVVPPNSSLPITLKFKPQEEIPYNFNLICDIKRKPGKLSLNVKGEGCVVHPVVQLECSNSSTTLIDTTDISTVQNLAGQWATLKPMPASNYCDFGLVQVFETATRSISISNQGKYTFDYEWEFKNLKSSIMLTEGKITNNVVRGASQIHVITFAPQYEETVDGCLFVLTVAGHFQYNIIVRGKSVAPALKFSFLHFDFGSCFVTKDDGDVITEETILRLTNRDTKNSISVDCEYQKIRSLMVDFTPVVLEPLAECSVPIRFAPRDVKDHAYVIPFLINGSSKVHVNVTGRGILPNVELVDVPTQRINFGAVNVGSTNTKSFTLANKSRRSIRVQLLDMAASLVDCGVTFNPTTTVDIPGRGTSTFRMTFSPTKRLPLFTQDLHIHYAGVTKKLLIVSGKAQGAEARLDSEFLSFGTVMLHSQTSKTLKLENVGDVPLTYQWLESTIGPHIDIRPRKGKIQVNSETVFEVQFQPTVVNSDIQCDDMQLEVAGVGTFSVSCTGACVLQPETDVQTFKFHSAVRKLCSKAVKINNPTQRVWHVSPSLVGADWSVAESLQVPARGSADLVLSYYPLTMAGSTAHSGKLFVPLPDGSALSYHLIGTTDAPESQGTVEVKCTARKPSVFSLSVKNWLATQQKLIVSYEISEKPSAATFLTVASAVDLHPGELKSLPVKLTAHCDGVVKGTIRLTNPISQEYMFYNFVGVVSAADVVETMVLESPVRVCTRKLIYIANPLPSTEPVQMKVPSAKINTDPHNSSESWWTCSSKDISIREVKSIAGRTEGIFEILYRPLIANNSDRNDVGSDATKHTLTIHTHQLGDFKYNLVLHAMPSAQRNTITFHVTLGSSETSKFSFKSFHSSKGEFATTVTGATGVFTAPKVIPVSEPARSVNQNADSFEGADVEGMVTFYPTELGTAHDTLTVSHPVWGQFEFDLIGECTPPAPQGPIVFNPTAEGKMREVTVRNCFTNSTTWDCKVDNPNFKVTTASLSIGARASGTCVITYEPVPTNSDQSAATPGIGAAIVGKLFVTCIQRPEIPPWVYYLKVNQDNAIK